jgi:hypothetical protein
MKRFILMTFAFLGVGFYELSGGSDFDPDAARLSAMETRQQLELARNEGRDISVAARNPSAKPPASPRAQDAGPAPRTTLNLVSYDTVMTAGDDDRAAPPATSPLPVPAPLATESGDAVDPDTRPIRVNVLDGAGTGITFAGLSNAASSADVVMPRDIRIVTGTLVNLRSGPGTNYEVVDQLARDTEVEVISDQGNGWVELRAVDGQTTGWMADSLLTKS